MPEPIDVCVTTLDSSHAHSLALDEARLRRQVPDSMTRLRYKTTRCTWLGGKRIERHTARVLGCDAQIACAHTDDTNACVRLRRHMSPQASHAERDGYAL